MTRDAAAEVARIAELQRLAYGRAATPAEAARAEAAAQELQTLLADRAAAAHPAPDLSDSPVDPADAAHATDDPDDTADPDEAPRRWWQRPPALVGALAAVVVGGSALAGVLAPPGPPAALTVFERAPDAAEQTLIDQLGQIGAAIPGIRVIERAQGVELAAFLAPAGTARQLAEAAAGDGGGGVFVDFPTRFDENGQPVRAAEEDDVCLMVLDGGFPSGTACAPADEFRERGVAVESSAGFVFSGVTYRGEWMPDGSVALEPTSG